MENDPANKAGGITKWDVKALREILETWDAISNVDRLEDGYAFATDHCHDTYDAGWDLLRKLEATIESAGTSEKS